MLLLLFSGRPVQCNKGKIRITKSSSDITQIMGTTVVIPCTATDSVPYSQYWKDIFGNVIHTEIDPRRKVCMN